MLEDACRERKDKNGTIMQPAQTASKPEAAPSVVSLRNEELIPEVKRFIDEGHTVTLRVRGRSMRIFLEHERDIVKLAKAGSVAVGDVVLAEIAPGKYVLHRVIQRQDDDLVLKGDGNSRGVETCRMENVVAKAIAFRRKGRQREDKVTGWKWRIYSWIWMRLNFMRRYLLAFYAKIWLRIFPPRIRL